MENITSAAGDGMTVLDGVYDAMAFMMLFAIMKNSINRT